MVKAIGKQVQEGTKMMQDGMKMFQVETNKERAEKAHKQKKADLDRQN
jgi:polyhydroxyalkanoate synthesis regulator protein